MSLLTLSNVVNENTCVYLQGFSNSISDKKSSNLNTTLQWKQLGMFGLFL